MSCSTAESTSDILLKVALNVFPASRCNETYFTSDSAELRFGVQEDSMICAGSYKDDQDTCSVGIVFFFCFSRRRQRTGNERKSNFSGRLRRSASGGKRGKSRHVHAIRHHVVRTGVLRRQRDARSVHQSVQVRGLDRTNRLAGCKLIRRGPTVPPKRNRTAAVFFFFVTNYTIRDFLENLPTALSLPEAIRIFISWFADVRFVLLFVILFLSKLPETCLYRNDQ